jgi:hypothetical protein
VAGQNNVSLKQCENMISTWGRGRRNFIMFLMVNQPNGPLQKQNKKVLWDAPQLIKLINMNHN